MAKLTRTYENMVDKTVLTFRGQDFTCTMIEDEEGGGSHSLEKCIDIQLRNTYPDDEDIDEILDLVDIIEMDDWERLENLERLEEFE
ncbi:MAG TPA: hypothetical protein VIK72_09505 [Clostridiaceae bacterium]